jgi:hypothetical protein
MFFQPCPCNLGRHPGLGAAIQVFDLCAGKRDPAADGGIFQREK